MALAEHAHPGRPAARARRRARARAARIPADWNARLARAGFVAPHWPAPWGLDAGPAEQLELDEVMRELAVPRPLNPIGIGWAGPTLLVAGHRGTAAASGCPGILDGSEIWCQLFSEPGAGSDLVVAHDPRRARRRRVRRQRPEGLDDARARRAVRASCSRAPTPTPRRTTASPTSSSTCARPASRCGRSCR